jgi:hypothetical protein
MNFIRHGAKADLASQLRDALPLPGPSRKSADASSTGVHSTEASGFGAIVLGGDCGSLGIVRSLGRRGIPICFVTDNSNPIAKFSRYTSRSLSWPGSQHENAVADLLELADRYAMKGWVLFPAADAEVQLVA